MRSPIKPALCELFGVNFAVFVLEKVVMDRIVGAVKWFNNTKGYGFISQPVGADVFVHYSSIQEKGYRTLKEGESVEFNVKVGPRGPQAENVMKLVGEEQQQEATA